MNSCFFLVQIMSNPKIKFLPGGIPILKIQVQQLRIRKEKKIIDQFEILLCGNLGRHFYQIYQIGDYVLLQGSLRFKRYKVKDRYQKKPQLAVKKVYSFLLNEVEKNVVLKF